MKRQMKLYDKAMPLTKTWCPLCSKSVYDNATGPLYMVLNIPFGEIAIPGLVKTEYVDLYVCERCCKRKGLIW